MGFYSSLKKQITIRSSRDAGILVVTIAIFMASAGAFTEAFISRNAVERESERAVSETRSRAAITALSHEVERLRRDLRAIQGVPSSGGRVDVEGARIYQIENRLSGIERGLMDSPEKALSVPMMRRDLQSLASANQNEIQSLRDDISRLYTLLLWLIGIIVTIALGLVGLVVTRSRQKAE